MNSLFFNITDTNYKRVNILKERGEVVTRVDISNSIVFFHIDFRSRKWTLPLKNRDRMLIFIVVEEGRVSIVDNTLEKTHYISSKKIALFLSSSQDILISIKRTPKSRVTLIFIADFFFKRHLTYKKSEPVDFIYKKLQNEITLELLSKEPIDALSHYIIESLINIPLKRSMQSLRAEHKILEFIIHRLSLLNINREEFDGDILSIANCIKNILVKEYIDPPSIKEMAHRCATNETKLKKSFKEVYRVTIREYIQKLRLQEANLLIKEKSLNVGEVAKRVGYNHQGYFSRLFFKYYGIYPKSLIKKTFSANKNTICAK